MVSLNDVFLPARRRLGSLNFPRESQHGYYSMQGQSMGKNQYSNHVHIVRVPAAIFFKRQVLRLENIRPLLNMADASV